MKKRDRRAHFFLILLLAVCVATCPLVTTNLRSGSPNISVAYAQPPIQFTPNVDELQLTVIALTALPVTLAAATPAFGPGQSYTESNKPEVSYIEGGDQEFGYGPTKEDADVYLMWTTDETGTHYYTVAADSDQLLGTRDALTGSRQPNGFVHIIEGYETKAQEVSDQELEVNKHQNARMSWNGGAVGTALAGGLICGIVTGGACYVAFGAAAIGAWVYGLVQKGEMASAQEGLDRLQGQLDRLELDLRGKFDQTIDAGASP